MPEEKKEEKQEAKPADASPETKPAEVRQGTKPAEIKPQDVQPPAEKAVPAGEPREKKEPEKAKKEKPANCAACNKSIKKKLHYYRDGKFYCNKRCWKTALKKEEAPQEPKT